MKAEDLRELLEPIGCWPATCHACGNQVAAEAEVEFRGSGVYEDDHKANPSAELLGLVHKKCAARKLRPPAKAKQGQGAFVTAGALEDWRRP